MTLAPATLADLPAIVELENSGFDHGVWGERAWADEIAGENRHVLVARDDDGRIVGVASFSALFEVAELLRVVVDAERRGRGIGRRLIGAGLSWAAGRGADVMMLEVEEGNAPARRLYDALGFGLVSRRADYYGVGQDALVMSLDLEAAAARESA